MQNAFLYIVLGAFWLFMVAVTGQRKTLTTYIYTFIGCGGIIYGLYQMFKNLTTAMLVVAIVIITVIITASICFYIFKHRDKFPVELTNDEVPELSAEEKFLRNAYKDEIDKEDTTPIE